MNDLNTMTNVITVQNEIGEEYNVEVSQEDYEKIISGDYNLATTYLRKAEERKNRLLAFQLLLNEKSKSNEYKSSSSSQPVNGSKSSASSSSSNMESNKHETIQHVPKKNVETTEHVNETQNLVECYSIEEISQRWLDKETKLLIELLRSNLDKLNDKKYKVKIIYQELAKQIPRFTAQQIESKIKNLKKTYKNILDSNTKTGRGTINWPYFDLLQDIFGKKPENNPLSIASNRSGFVMNSAPNDASTSTDVDTGESDTETGGPSKKISCLENTAGILSNNNDAAGSRELVSKKKNVSTQPEWIKEFRKEMADRHKEKMEMQQQFLNFFKDWVNKSKD